MNPDNDSPENPFAAPNTQDDIWTLDRSGVGRRVAEIVTVSVLGAIGGGVIGTAFFPNFRIGDGGGNLMVIAGAVGCLIAWAAIKLRSMRKLSGTISPDAHESP